MQKALQLPFFSSLSLSPQCFSMDCRKLLMILLRSVTKEVCDQDLTHSLDTPKSTFVKIVSDIFIQDACNT